MRLISTSSKYGHSGALGPKVWLRSQNSRPVRPAGCISQASRSITGAGSADLGAAIGDILRLSCPTVQPNHDAVLMSDLGRTVRTCQFRPRRRREQLGDAAARLRERGRQRLPVLEAQGRQGDGEGGAAPGAVGDGLPDRADAGGVLLVVEGDPGLADALQLL